MNACGTLAHTYTDPGSYAVTLTVTTPQGCTDQLTQPGAVLVQPAPKATFVWTPNPGTELNSNLYFSATDPYATTFAWDFAGLGSSDARQVYHEFQNEFGDTYDVCLQVWDRYGCTDTLCQVVPIVVPSLFTPNAFTPDGDGKNEVFFPVTADMVDEEHELLVFDRWGELIFQTTDARKGWDGRAMSGGDVLPQGVYVWRLVERKAFTADKAAWFGTVTLLK
jgi:gliding motility-associated-like protein